MRISCRKLGFKSLDLDLEEFDLLQANRFKKVAVTQSCREALQNVNLSKNCYTDVIPFDENRVVLKSSKDTRSSGRDYINASFVEVGRLVPVNPFHSL
ncbi:hypothetical protein MKW98_009489 [Papaver atlanticum]|uniref:Tyrosine-protein phosphatase domain-containing protein n=1 Tax=Papaver atlanticum TaxID=357466 RepID=A0AAD4SHR1_9MAGN|nr:hypothetical protein MKW98_009489 [Papaver atlanticum]